MLDGLGVYTCTHTHTLRGPGAMSLNLRKGHIKLKAKVATERQNVFIVMPEFKRAIFLTNECKWHITLVSIIGIKIWLCLI